MGRILGQGTLKFGAREFLWIALELSDEEIEAQYPEVCRRYRDIVETWYSGAPEGIVGQLESCDEDAVEMLVDWLARSPYEDSYMPLISEVAIARAASKVLNEALSRGEIVAAEKFKISAFDLTPFPDPGFGIPEFSVYENAEARSVMGAWVYTAMDFPSTICYNLQLRTDCRSQESDCPCDVLEDKYYESRAWITPERGERVFVVVENIWGEKD